MVKTEAQFCTLLEVRIFPDAVARRSFAAGVKWKQISSCRRMMVQQLIRQAGGVSQVPSRLIQSVQERPETVQCSTKLHAIPVIDMKGIADAHHRIHVIAELAKTGASSRFASGWTWIWCKKIMLLLIQFDVISCFLRPSGINFSGDQPWRGSFSAARIPRCGTRVLLSESGGERSECNQAWEVCWLRALLRDERWGGQLGRQSHPIQSRRWTKACPALHASKAETFQVPTNYNLSLHQISKITPAKP